MAVYRRTVPVERVEYVDHHEHHSNSGAIWAIALIILLAILITYGLPAIRSFGGGGTQINVPDKINVNVSQTKP
jgi:hypothetical protein